MDDIQRKLRLIDSQLVGRSGLYKQIISTCPLIFAAAGLITGIALQNVLDLPILFWLILLAISSTLVLLLFIKQRPDNSNSYALVPLSSCALVCSLCLGAIRLINYSQPSANDVCNLTTEKQVLATIHGQILTEPFITKNNKWQFARFKYTDPATSFYLKVNEVESTKGSIPAGGVIRVYVNDPVLDLKAGDNIRMYCRLNKFRKATNPGQFDVADYLAKRNIFVAASVKSRDAIDLLESRRVGVAARVRQKIKHAASQVLLQGLPAEDQSYGLLEALLLGYRGNIKNDIYIAFKKTGLLHFISLSGMHLGILMAIVWWIGRMGGLLKRGRAVLCLVALGVFLLIVPPRAPVLRAAVISSVFCLSFLFRRKSNPFNTLSLAAIILLLARPTNLFEAGWQLSFASVLGILLFTDKIANFVYDKTHLWFLFKKNQKVNLQTIFKSLLRFVVNLFSVGLAAWLGSAGILLYHFYTINPLTCIWTVIAFPLVALILGFGFLQMILACLLPTAGWALGIIVNQLADFLIAVVRFIAGLDVSEILIGNVPTTLIIFYYGIILFVIFGYFKQPVVKRIIVTIMVLLLGIWLGTLKWQKTYNSNLILTCLDVGHGQAILTELPGNENILFDAGSLSKSDIGNKIVTGFLDYKGITKIDKLLISHNDVDHINGIPEIVEHRKINGVYANRAFFEKDKWKTAEFLRDWLNEKGFEINPVGEEINTGDAKIKVIWPNKGYTDTEQLSDNDKSLVYLIEFSGKRVLLCSDIEKFAQRQLMQLYPDLKTDIVVVPHHGSAGTLDTDFLENLEADVLICSCGRRQYKKQTLLKYKNCNKLFFTARDGAIAVSIDKNGRIKTALTVK